MRSKLYALLYGAMALLPLALPATPESSLAYLRKQVEPLGVHAANDLADYPFGEETEAALLQALKECAEFGDNDLRYAEALEVVGTYYWKDRNRRVAADAADAVPSVEEQEKRDAMIAAAIVDYCRALAIRVKARGKTDAGLLPDIDRLSRLDASVQIDGTPLSELAVGMAGAANLDNAAMAETLVALSMRFGGTAAESLRLRALAIREKAVGNDDARLLDDLLGLGLLYAARKQFPQAEPYFQRVLAVIDRAKADEKFIRQFLVLATWYSQCQKPQEAEKCYLRTLPLLDLPPSRTLLTQRLDCLAGLARLKTAAGDVRNAILYSQQAIGLSVLLYGEMSDPVVSRYEEYADILKKGGFTAEANMLALRVNGMRDEIKRRQEALDRGEAPR